MAKGRPAQSGPRGNDGRLIKTPEQKRVPANDVVQARHAWYTERWGAKVAGDTHDAIGRAWAAGLLENERHDPAVIRDAGRNYARMHATVFARVGVQCANPDRVRGTGDGSWDDPIGERYAKMDQCAKDSGSKERLAMRKLCIEGSPDENPAWLDRLIRNAWWIKHRPVGSLVELATDRDRMILTQAIRALVAMVEG